jgi:hypothetical protein
MLEFAISFAGLIMFIYVLLNVWVWLNSIMVERQRAFQRTRVSAGQEGTAGAPVGYARPPIRLVGLPTSPGGDKPASPLDLVIGEPPCVAAEPFYTEATRLLGEARAIADGPLAAATARAQALQKQIQATIAYCSGRSTRKRRGRCFAELLPPLQAQLKAVTDQIRTLSDQIRDLMDRARDQVKLGREACRR